MRIIRSQQPQAIVRNRYAAGAPAAITRIISEMNYNILSIKVNQAAQTRMVKRLSLSVARQSPHAVLLQTI